MNSNGDNNSITNDFKQRFCMPCKENFLPRKPLNNRSGSLVIINQNNEQSNGVKNQTCDVSQSFIIISLFYPCGKMLNCDI